MNEEDKIHINSFKFYDRDELEDLTKEYYLENQQLKEEFDRMFAIYHSRKLIKKFNDEYDEEDKMKNPNRDYACVCPDAEEVYKRYYELKEQLKQKEDIINKAKEFAKEHIFQFDGDKDFDALLEILDNKGE